MKFIKVSRWPQRQYWALYTTGKLWINSGGVGLNLTCFIDLGHIRVMIKIGRE